MLEQTNAAFQSRNVLAIDLIITEKAKIYKGNVISDPQQRGANREGANASPFRLNEKKAHD